jgi:ribonuclease HI
MITIYTDGGCNNLSQDIGGWGLVVVEDDKDIVEEMDGLITEGKITNNVCELHAFTQALYFAEAHDVDVILSDSTYVVNGFNSWMHRWKNKNWANVSNLDLWKELYRLKDVDVEVKWIRGHDGNEFNDRADVLASKYRENQV